MARLKEKYTAEVAPALMKQFGYKLSLIHIYCARRVLR